MKRRRLEGGTRGERGANETCTQAGLGINLFPCELPVHAAEAPRLSELASSEPSPINGKPAVCLLFVPSVKGNRVVNV